MALPSTLSGSTRLQAHAVIHPDRWRPRFDRIAADPDYEVTAKVRRRPVEGDQPHVCGSPGAVWAVPPGRRLVSCPWTVNAELRRRIPPSSATQAQPGRVDGCQTRLWRCSRLTNRSRSSSARGSACRRGSVFTMPAGDGAQPACRCRGFVHACSPCEAIQGVGLGGT